MLERKRYAVCKMSPRIGHFSRSSLRYDEQEEFEMDRMISRLEMDVLTRKLVDKTYETVETYKLPTSWWQHLKRDYFPEWFKRKWPVKETEHTVKLKVEFERYATYPEADIEMPNRFGEMYLYENFRVLEGPGGKNYESY